MRAGIRTVTEAAPSPRYSAVHELAGALERNA